MKSDANPSCPPRIDASDKRAHAVAEVQIEPLKLNPSTGNNTWAYGPFPVENPC